MIDCKDNPAAEERHAAAKIQAAPNQNEPGLCPNGVRYEPQKGIADGRDCGSFKPRWSDGVNRSAHAPIWLAIVTVAIAGTPTIGSARLASVSTFTPTTDISIKSGTTTEITIIGNTTTAAGTIKAAAGSPSKF